MLHLPTLQTLLQRHVRTGGFPAALAEEATTGTVSDQTIRTIWELIEGEVTRSNRDAVRAYRAIEHVVRALGQRTNWSKMGETLGVNYHTAEEYATLLAKAFALLILYKQDPVRGGAHLGAEKTLPHRSAPGLPARPDSPGSSRAYPTISRRKRGDHGTVPQHRAAAR